MVTCWLVYLEVGHSWVFSYSWNSTYYWYCGTCGIYGGTLHRIRMSRFSYLSFLITKTLSLNHFKIIFFWLTPFSPILFARKMDFLLYLTIYSFFIASFSFSGSIYLMNEQRHFPRQAWATPTLWVACTSSFEAMNASSYLLRQVFWSSGFISMLLVASFTLIFLKFNLFYLLHNIKSCLRY